jgi:hypothetical protein
VGFRVAVKKTKSSRGKYATELERLRELSAINEVLKKSDIENAALTNTSKDSETVNDNVLDNMLDQLNMSRNANKDLAIVERLSSQKSGRMTPVIRRAKVQKGRKKTVKINRAPHKKQKGKTAKKKKR